MNNDRELLELAEEALVKANHFHDYEDALAAIREALAEQFRDATKMVAEPVKQDTPYCKSAPMCAKPCGDESCVEPVKQESVAWMWIPSDAFPDCTVVTDDPNKLESAKAYGRPIIPLYAAPVDAKAIQFALANARAEALEEAAKVCDDESRYSNDAECCAAAIRGLK